LNLVVNTRTGAAFWSTSYIRRSGPGAGKNSSRSFGSVSKVTPRAAEIALADFQSALRNGTALSASRAMQQRHSRKPRAPRDPSQPKRKSQPQPSLPYDKVPALYARLIAMDNAEPVRARALRFAILTGARACEVWATTETGDGMTWEEIDLTSKTWTRPAARMKMDCEHRLPLTDEAIACLGTPGTGPVFPGLKDEFMGCAKGGFMYWLRHEFNLRDPRAIAKRDYVVDGVKAGEARYVTNHGFRSSFGTWAEDQEYDIPLIDVALAHQKKGKVTRVYLRSDRFPARRELHERWARFVTGK
jgi:integrase